MDPFLYLLIAATGVVLAFIVWMTRPRSRPKLPFSKRPALLTAGELRFYRAVLPVVPSGMALFVKVRLMDLVAVPDGSWQQYGARGSGMHVDFVLANAATTEPRLVVELDDSSHQRVEAQERDAFKDAALGSAGIPVLRVTAAWKYDTRDLRGRIAAAV